MILLIRDDHVWRWSCIYDFAITYEIYKMRHVPLLGPN